MNEGPVKTSPYSFSNFDGKGITYSMKLKNNNSVLSLDMLLNNFDTLLDEHKISPSAKAFILGPEGAVYSHSKNTNDTEKKQILRLMDNEQENLSNNKTIQDIIRIDGSKFFINMREINNIIGENNFFGTVTPYSEIAAVYKERNYTVFSAFIITFIIMIPVMWYFISMLVKPITCLKKESDKVSKRKFEQVHKIKTKVVELNELSSSIYTMSQSIHDYQRNLEQKIEERTKKLEEANEVLRSLSITDKLTGLYNRIQLDKVLNAEIIRSERYNSTFSLIIIDIDHFKLVNDTFGHQTGDRVLLEFAQILKNSVRSADTVGRWGGEEFIVICPETNQEGAEKLAEHLRELVAEHVFTKVGQKTASFGVATYTPGEKEQELISRADEALYEAKNSGRNKVVIG